MHMQVGGGGRGRGTGIINRLQIVGCHVAAEMVRYRTSVMFPVASLVHALESLLYPGLVAVLSVQQPRSRALAHSHGQDILWGKICPVHDQGQTRQVTVLGWKVEAGHPMP